MMTLVKTAFLSGALVAIAPGIILADPIEKKGTSPYVTHFIFRPVQALEVSGLGTATLLEAVGTTQNMKGEKMFDKITISSANRPEILSMPPQNGIGLNHAGQSDQAWPQSCQ